MLREPVRTRKKGYLLGFHIEEDGIVQDHDDLNPMTLFLGEIYKGPLLTAAQEWALGYCIQGHKSRVLGVGNEYPTKEEAIHILVERNMRLVVSVARRFNGRGLPIEDLVQEGSLGLRRAAEKFNPDKGYRFSTYSVWWIRQSIGRSILENGRTIRLPIHMIGYLSKFLKARDDLSMRLGREPNDEEIAELTELSLYNVRQARRASESSPSSLDREHGDGEESSALHTLVDKDPSANPEEAYEATGLAYDLAVLLSRLPDREKSVVVMRFGLFGNKEPKTLEEAGKALGVTRERARQIEMDAMKRIKREAEKDHLLHGYISKPTKALV